MLFLISCINSKPAEFIQDSAVDTNSEQQPLEPAVDQPSLEPSVDPLDVDDDGDGYTENQNDCDDTDPSIYPQAPEIPQDGIDQDCDGEDLPFIVRFIALGDAGEGNEAQYAVSDAIETICDEKTDFMDGCAFALYLGDNFYESGVDSIDDPQFQSKFEDPYSNLDFPFYISMGNHDYGGDCFVTDCGGIGNEFERSEYQIAYSDISEKWTMPDVYYSFVRDHVQFYALDTTVLMWDGWWWSDMPEGQEDWIDSEWSNSQAQWHIAFGHHPYISNGRHGNAGTYEGLEWSIYPDALVGTYVQEFMETYICNRMDLLLSGHDHNRQWLEPTCGTEFIVSGAGAKTTNLENRGNPTFFEDDQETGFLWVEIRGECLSAAFYNRYAELDFSQEICK